MKNYDVITEVSAAAIRAKNKKDVTDRERERRRVRRAVEDRELARELGLTVQELYGL